MEFRVSAKKQVAGLMNLTPRREQLGPCERVQVQHRAAPNQSLRHALHQREHLRAGQQKTARPAILIDPDFEMTQERRSVLNFVDDHRLRIGLDQGVGCGARSLRVRREIECQVGRAGIEMPQQRGLAGLPRAGDQDDGKLLRHPPDERLNFSRNLHADNMHDQCNLCNYLDCDLSPQQPDESCGGFPHTLHSGVETDCFHLARFTHMKL